MATDLRETLDEEWAARIQRRDALAREIEERQLALQTLEIELNVLAHIRQSSGLSTRRATKKTPAQPKRNGDRPGPRKQVLEYLRKKLLVGASFDAIAGDLLDRIESSARNKRQLLNSTIYQLKKAGCVDLRDGVYYFVRDKGE